MNLLSKEEFLKKLKIDGDFNSRYGRKHITEGKMVLPPCHYGFQVYTRELSLEERSKLCTSNITTSNILEVSENCKSIGFDEDDFLHQQLDLFNVPRRAISLLWNQRSVDTFLGLPFNIASYALLLEIVAKEVNMVPDELIGTLGDTHLYLNHIEQAKEQISRKPYELPRLKMNDGPPSIIEKTRYWRSEDFWVEDYKSHPAIKAPLSN